MLIHTGHWKRGRETAGLREAVHLTYPKLPKAMVLSPTNLSQLGSFYAPHLIKARQVSKWIPSSIRKFLKLDSLQARQIGDPTLRQRAEAVEISTIRSPEFKQMVERMFKVMRKANVSSISAPQIGVRLRVIALEKTAKQIKELKEADVTDQDIKTFGIVKIPPTVLINPKYKIIDSTSVTLRENCVSFKGYSALVPRAKEIEVSALNREAGPVTWRTVGWPARLIQHEVDHLNGKLFVDSMLPETLMDDNWRSFTRK